MTDDFILSWKLGAKRMMILAAKNKPKFKDKKDTNSWERLTLILFVWISTPTKEIIEQMAITGIAKERNNDFVDVSSCAIVSHSFFGLMNRFRSLVKEWIIVCERYFIVWASMFWIRSKLNKLF